MHVYMYICILMDMYIYQCGAWVYMCIYVCMFLYRWVRTHTYIDVSIYAWIMNQPTCIS